MVKNPHSNAGDAGSIPGPGTKIPHAAGQLRPRATTTEPEHSGAHVPQLALEKPTRHNKEEPTCHNEDTVQERERERERMEERKKERKKGREGGREEERKKENTQCITFQCSYSSHHSHSAPISAGN